MGGLYHGVGWEQNLLLLEIGTIHYVTQFTRIDPRNFKKAKPGAAQG